LLFKILQNYYAKYLLIIGSIIGGYSALFLQSGEPSYQSIDPCVFKSITSLPCPGCGMGRATLALFHGNIPLSFSYNILCIPFTVAVFISLIWAIRDLSKHSDSLIKFISRDISAPYKAALFAVIMVDWTINLIRL
jgi:hypothetical protein